MVLATTRNPRIDGYMIYELRTKFRLGRTYRGLYRVLGGPIKRYTTKLVQGSYVLLSVLLLYPCTGIIIAVLRIFLLLPPLPF